MKWHEKPNAHNAKSEHYKWIIIETITCDNTLFENQ